MADEVRHDVFPFSGNTRIHLPHLDRLAGKSAVFRRAYCSQPVSPCSRSTILTGRYPHNTGVLQHGVPLAKDVPTLVELMSESDYKSAYMGLWVLGHEIDRQHGFNHWVSIEDGYRNMPGEADCGGRHSSYAQFLTDHGFRPDALKRGLPLFSRYFCTRLPERFSKASFLAQKAVEFIRGNAGAPFILYVSFLEPHPPNASVNDDLYRPEEVDLPPAFHLEPSEDIPLRCRFNRRFYGDHPADRHGCSVEPLSDEDAWRRYIARYWGKISLVDQQIGKIIEELVAREIEKNTIIVFTSDHGDMMGDFRMLAKGVQFESSVRVPLMVHIPGITNESLLVDGPISQVDIVPTLLELLEEKANDDLDGLSLLPVIMRSQTPSHDVFIEWNGPDGADKWCAPYFSGEEKKRVDAITSAPVRTIVTQDNWKLSRSAAGEHELYDLNTDPLETKNLFSNGSFTERIEELTQRIAAWQQRVNDPADLGLSDP